MDAVVFQKCREIISSVTFTKKVVIVIIKMILRLKTLVVPLILSYNKCYSIMKDEFPTTSVFNQLPLPIMIEPNDEI